jgi:hypothetical protein
MHAIPFDSHGDRDRPDLDDRTAYHGDGLTVRAYTAEELRVRLGPSATPPDRATTPLPPAPAWTTPAPLRPATPSGEPGGSARAEYRRLRAAELTRWAAGLPWRAGLAAAAGLAGDQLAAHANLPHPGVAGLLAAVAAAWTLRFQASQPTRAWRDGARGERATARRLRALERHGYTVLHDLQVPRSRANLDHLVIGPSGVWVLDSKYYRGALHQAPDGMLWHGRWPLAQQIATVVWEAMQLTEALELEPEVPVTPLLIVHRASVPWGGLLAAGVEVIPPGVLVHTIGREPVLPAAQVSRLARLAAARLRPAG